MAQEEARQVAEYWDRIAPAFDTIYSGNKNRAARTLDKWLRRDMYERFNWVMRKAGDEGADEDQGVQQDQGEHPARCAPPEPLKEATGCLAGRLRCGPGFRVVAHPRPSTGVLRPTLVVDFPRAGGATAVRVAARLPNRARMHVQMHARAARNLHMALEGDPRPIAELRCHPLPLLPGELARRRAQSPTEGRRMSSLLLDAFPDRGISAPRRVRRRVLRNLRPALLRGVQASLTR